MLTVACNKAHFKKKIDMTSCFFIVDISVGILATMNDDANKSEYSSEMETKCLRH